MRPRERRETGEQDLFRSRLDQIIDMNHPLVRLARTVDWPFLEARFGEVYADGAGQPPLPTRLMAGLAILKHTYDLSDEVLCERWVENPYYQYFCGEEFFQHHLVFDRSLITRWLNRMGEERLHRNPCGISKRKSDGRNLPNRCSALTPCDKLIRSAHARKRAVQDSRDPLAER